MIIEEKRNMLNNIRIKEQKLIQDKCEISRNDCEEFIRIVKKYSNFFDKNDLIKYCKSNNIPLNEDTINCMFEELIINKKIKSNKINVDDLISLISKKKKRCFYIPIVTYIGKWNYLMNYEKELKKEMDLNEKEKKREKDKLKKQYKKDENDKKENELKRYISEDKIFILHNDNDDDNDNLTSLNNEEMILENRNMKEYKNDNNYFEIKENINNNENHEGKILKEKLDKKINIELYENKEKNNKKSFVQSNNKYKENSRKIDNVKMKKLTLNEKNKNIQEKQYKKYEKKENENLIESNDKNEENKKSYYELLLQKVLNNKQKKCKKKEYLKSFHLVIHFKLNELIYISYLIEKYYNYYNKREYYDLIDIYEEINKRKKKNKDISNNSEIDLINNNNLLYYIEKNLECTCNVKDINPSDIFTRYEEERKKKDRNIYNNNTSKYINSDLLTNYRFIEKNLYDIMNSVLSNINLFFNQNINDVEKLKNQYDTVIKNIDKYDDYSNFTKENVKEEIFEKKNDSDKSDKYSNENNSNEKIEKVFNKDQFYKGSDEIFNDNIKIEKNFDNNNMNKTNEEKFSENVRNEKNEEKINKYKSIKKKESNFSKLNTKEKETTDIKKEESLKYKEYKLFKVMLKKEKKVNIKKFEKFNSNINTPKTNDFEYEERKFESDYAINYLNLKYKKEELEKLQNKNLIYYLTNDIYQINIFKKTYFYDFFFIYLFRKLFWNILALYNLYLEKYKMYNYNFYDEDKKKKKYDNLIIYESDVSLNNSKKNKKFLYNTNELLCNNLTNLFELIKKEKLLIYLRYDENKKIKIKNKTEYIYRDIWIYLILTALKKNLKNFNFNKFIHFQELKDINYS
ncbi:conserved Plasmodium protein, unknown function [Plasmodium gallinaceum]|uniref:Uncharacterized protein n=1 Tax=Plasmodium gallinaceum TaxID=5849 RepID=A0A1J1GTF2_PLAGA|nr:conserved Plasmodium protein, unknown function [Plasmodium gallinaceum]CRG95727.1 conserved Plasmodium protein, unknown function [Plasmodium gallinaceum]